MMTQNLNSIIIHEVGLRDGLQVEPVIVPTRIKIDWIKKIIQSGIRHIQIGSFVHTKLIPQMADTDDLFTEIRKCRDLPSDLVLTGLVLNEKGLSRAYDVKPDKIVMGVSASETHSLKNTKMTVEEATGRIISMAKGAILNGYSVQVSVQSAFGCGFDGKIPQEKVLSIIDKYFNNGLNNISLADTAGHASPDAVESLFDKILKMNPDAQLACHFHNTYGMGMLNIMAAVNSGVKYVETSFGGLGGCPFTKVAAGNVATEDFVHLLNRLGFNPKINLSELIHLSKDVSDFLGKELPGFIYKIGPINWSN
jgi:hydroxymethylglutaryl-CoA lyase